MSCKRVKIYLNLKMYNNTVWVEYELNGKLIKFYNMLAQDSWSDYYCSTSSTSANHYVEFNSLLLILTGLDNEEM